MAEGGTTDLVSVAASQIVQSVQRSPSPFPLSSSQTAASSETPPTKKRKRIFHRYKQWTPLLPVAFETLR